MKVLFVCEDNACTSIIAEAMTWEHWGDSFEVASAGIRPLGNIPEEFQCVVPVRYWDYRPKSLKEVNVQDFELIISFYSESLEEFLPGSFAGRVEDWSAIIWPCSENTDNFDKYKETMYLLLSALLVNPTAYVNEDSIYCEVHNVVMSQKEVSMTMHVNASYSPDYLQELKEMKRAEHELFPNTIKILESFNWEEGETNLQLSCPKCQEAQSLWEEQREKQAIEREVGLVERLLAEKGGEREEDLRIIGSLFAKQHMMTRGGLYGKVVKCLAETMHWTQEEMRILTQAFQAENERYYQMKEEGLDPFEEIKPFMQSFDPENYKSPESNNSGKKSLR
jgi:protein-tyrosine-phosphatase